MALVRQSGPAVAHQLPKVLRMWSAAGREVYLLHAQRQGVLQARLHEVSASIRLKLK